MPLSSGMEYSGPSSLKGREQAPSPATIVSSPGQGAFASPQLSKLVCDFKTLLLLYLCDLH